MDFFEKLEHEISDFNAPEEQKMKFVRRLAHYPCREVLNLLDRAAVLDPSFNVRKAAASNFRYPEHLRKARVLAQYPCQEVVEVLCKCAVVDPSVAVRRAAVHAVKKIAPDAALLLFIKKIRHRNPEVLVRIIHALGQLGHTDRKQVIQQVSPFLISSDAMVRQVAAETVNKLVRLNGQGR